MFISKSENNQKVLLGVQQNESINAVSKKQVKEFEIYVLPLEIHEEIKDYNYTISVLLIIKFNYILKEDTK